ncbi:hypothetical protein [Nannocystis pusilla]|uniref:hypothetical protein n=1 Tax=Nannocystis pusilla TaxID=889268 RepID=UPI003DA48A99
MSSPSHAPIYLGIQSLNGERVGLLCYAFRCNAAPIKGRPADEHRIQIRYGSERTWFDRDHPLGRDVAGVDTTIVVGVHLERELLVGLDPIRYDPLPMGISIEFKEVDLQAVEESGWHVWERENRRGRRRESRTDEGLETLVGFSPERLLRYVGFEQRASSLGLDPPLRYMAAEAAAADPISGGGHERHYLTQQFDLSSDEILNLIARRARLSIALRGGVAEHHLQRALDRDPMVAAVTQIDRDGEPDLAVELQDGRKIRVECKNVSPKPDPQGRPRVEVQKTRSQRDNPAGRFYRPEQFDVVAACLYARTERWEFRYKATRNMPRHVRYPERLAVMHSVDETWAERLEEALNAED